MADENEDVAAVDPIVDQGAQAKELKLTAADCPYAAQGAQAKELKLTAADCPYAAQGDARAKWFEGFGEADPDAPAAE